MFLIINQVVHSVVCVNQTQMSLLNKHHSVADLNPRYEYVAEKLYSEKILYSIL